jgi:secreted trypsin-like serine protease
MRFLSPDRIQVSATAVLLVGALATMMVGCTGQVASSDETTAEALTDGTVDNGDPAIMSVKSETPNGEVAFCTAVLLSERVLATAAHCIKGERNIRVVTGTNVVFELSHLAVASVWYDPSYDEETITHDFGMVVLAEPTTVTPLTHVSSSLASAVAELNAGLTAVGYGQIKATNDIYNSAGVGIKRIAHLAYDGINANDIIVGKAGDTFCFGDSGGPLLARINGSVTVVGVGSYINAGSPLCDGPGSYQRIDIYDAVIDKQIKAARIN